VARGWRDPRRPREQRPSRVASLLAVGLQTTLIDKIQAPPFPDRKAPDVDVTRLVLVVIPAIAFWLAVQVRDRRSKDHRIRRRRRRRRRRQLDCRRVANAVVQVCTGISLGARRSAWGL
jgi:hypothetical protein